MQYRADGATKVDSGRTGKHAAVAVAENAAVQLAKLGGLLGLSPVAERNLGTFTAPDDEGDLYAFDAAGVECDTRLFVQELERAIDRPRSAIDARRDERVIDVADG